ncbi:fumarylacetoacetate hydrolase family protein [Devosia sp. WQ 349]|uniref:fumarylacetoacetate hydrolase family protein n=1 Tax=Devosia sp. WQ 349K1 TaxID=2800329 RepID=UPI001903EDA5|nr:fumarylacetoacetate hydrolase family protein [Devosia sp. WQ 349K1]MBK1796100.1 fumarylacetoacetate hydrolase family protein [Devosia sp. WQ 349K1]
MKLARFSQASVDGVRIGRVEGDTIIDLSAFLGVNASMRHLIANLEALKGQLDAIKTPILKLSDVTLEAPINDPQKYLAIGMNYKEHAEEARAAGITIPTSQMWFNKQVSCINGPFAPVVKWTAVEKCDYEIELAVVIGKKCHQVKREDARSVVAGYMVSNDVSARDWLPKSPTFTLGKSWDTHGPIGPWITTDDEIEDPLNLEMKLWINNELRQNHRTNDMIYNIWDQIAYLTQVMTLEPGDIIATGTPSGIGAPKGIFLQPGDVMRLEIEGLGTIENPVVAEKA